MTQITARLPQGLVATLDGAAKRMRRSRAEMVRKAVEYYLEDIEDLTLGLAALEDPSDPVLSWKDVKRALRSKH